MGLSHLARPSILCQCACCSSSLAACENEWARLSDTYSTVTGWLSIDLDRIRVSSDKKQIPQSSSLDFVRGRVIQEIVCRLCHQKLGALVHLEPDEKVFWKLSKVSFREIISMKESQPVFREGSLPWLLFSDQHEVVAQDESAASPSTPSVSETTLNKAIKSQGASLHRISSSVDELHDTMADLKQSFKSLRLELHTTPSYRGQVGQCDEAMDMLKIVLKELQSKADDIEKLRLENESLKLKNRYLEERLVGDSTPRLLEGRFIPAVQSPGFLNENGRRSWTESVANQQIPDSFEGDIESLDRTPIADPNEPGLPPIKVPLKPAVEKLPMHIRQLPSQDDQAVSGTTRSRRNSGEPATKRQRLNISEESVSSVNVQVPKEKRGRPRKSQISTSSVLQPPNSTTVVPTPESHDTSPVTPAEELSVHPVEELARSGGPRTRGRLRTRSRPSVSRALSREVSTTSRTTRQSKLQETSSQQSSEKQTNIAETEIQRTPVVEVAVNVAELTPQSEIEGNDLFAKGKREKGHKEGNENNPDEHNARLTGKDALAKAAMEREEAMADG
ncbi:hypothetical protein BGW36DRAFT_304448 [Talaromyces proteolyticus]|uniref:Mis18 domain-containing protein n=1 Tax=Talaromyces proteolyticus TaxID=1131652 RepID=A0AAD4KMK2_9EURO|nr:uncharacterized protein BGW36DRAFT_304448 [Talaromyces proteolyticus]KAH8691952.1 hypothetical protein BGW36DRAFT_304448 [Talaromyces proteolyticus]